mmetsp:Transcript_117275/g.269386  ORF Transcript_117275/g.269386 Transcript_117275/m.269386 type:complete len:98 (+) Transcript_117275:567-860(+)
MWCRRLSTPLRRHGQVLRLRANLQVFQSARLSISYLHSAGGEKMMTFGKHRGRLFRDVIAEDPQYADWALRQPSPGQALSPFLAFVKAWKAESNSKK